jgi:alkaline phosphatase
VFSIEADIYLSDNRLLVAHDKKDPDSNREATAASLDSLYLQPIIELFRRHKGKISNESSYAPVLMIDIKESRLPSGGEAVLKELIKLLSKQLSVFDRSVNSNAVQIVISGDRGPVSSWISYPAFIFFDGRPNEVYDSATLQRVAFISDSWLAYQLPPIDEGERLKAVIKKVHGTGKLLRLWASPDNPESWKLQAELGIDIINTDKPEECRKYFNKN